MKTNKLLSTILLFYSAIIPITMQARPAGEPEKHDDHIVIYFVTWASTVHPTPDIKFAAIFYQSENNVFLNTPKSDTDGADWGRAYTVPFIAVVDENGNKEFVRVRNNLFEYSRNADFTQIFTPHPPAHYDPSTLLKYHGWEQKPESVEISDLLRVNQAKSLFKHKR